MTTKQKLRIGIFTLLSVLGVVLIALGVQDTDSFLFTLFLASGGALIGAGLPLIILQLLGSDADELQKYLLGESHFGSSPSLASSCKGKWYVYHTTAKDGRRVWQHYVMNLESNSLLGTLQGTLVTLDRRGSKQKYIVEAGARADRMVVIGSPEKGNEPPFIQIVKGATFAHLEVRWGVDFHQTWDGDSSVSACLFSRSPLVPVPLGQTLDTDSQRTLEDLCENVARVQGIGTLITSVQQLGGADSEPAGGSTAAHPSRSRRP